ncbi:MAG TPA: ribonuclease HII [Aggregatilineales bacterium]|nr:ribonuclease HII [Aggregatilineales bacterium]
MGEAIVCGLDEVGRGPLAGPLMAAAVIFPPGFVFTEAYPDLAFRDSKQLSRRQRDRVIQAIRDTAQCTLVETIPVPEINLMGIGWANRVIFERLIMAVDADRYVVDGRLKLSNLGRRAPRVESKIHADQIHQAVMAASILAKVERDRLMEKLHAEFPVYGWDHNRGYGTPAHIAALRAYGPCPYHRTQFVTTALSKYLNLPLY